MCLGHEKLKNILQEKERAEGRGIMITLKQGVMITLSSNICWVTLITVGPNDPLRIKHITFWTI